MTRFFRRGAGSIWESPLVRALAGQWGTGANPTVLRSLGGQFVPLSTGPQGPSRGPGDAGTDRLLEWTRSDRLTYGEAETLLALDESTPWHA